MLKSQSPKFALYAGAVVLFLIQLLSAGIDKIAPEYFSSPILFFTHQMEEGVPLAKGGLIFYVLGTYLLWHFFFMFRRVVRDRISFEGMKPGIAYALGALCLFLAEILVYCVGVWLPNLYSPVTLNLPLMEGGQWSLEYWWSQVPYYVPEILMMVLAWTIVGFVADSAISRDDKRPRPQMA
ncbi:MAG: hypothetical protein KDD64_00965 [Bdellovibrionales bacterium]|nr:hypothetical protein [Bdellovibrionales bacterium]